MTPQTDLEIKGSFYAHPFAELVTEIHTARLTGSLRISEKEKKSVVYFKAGRVAFAVSNSRTARLFDILIRREKLTSDDLAKIPNFSNDLELAAILQDKQLLTKTECDQLFSEQIEGIVIDIFSWLSGEWTFSSLARIRDGLAFDIDVPRLLINFGRTMPVDTMLGRFRSLGESFGRSAVPESTLHLMPDEAFVLSRADEGPLTAADLVSVAAMQESTALQAIYTLWLGGLLVRRDWQPAFSAASIAAMKGARLELKQEAKLRHSQTAADAANESKPVVVVPEKETDAPITLDEYLGRTENAGTYYDILGVDTKADIDELKRAYFSLAKMFHPDRYHSTGGETLRRIQHAFTELAQAHETLKNEESREMYDYRIRKELSDREKREAGGSTGTGDMMIEQGIENFERGFSLLMDNEPDAALPFLARAIHFSPKNGRYHSYYGKALSADPNKRHKAEAEMQTGLKLDPDNPTLRIVLAEFFVEHNLLKRAEGELNRLLAIFPSNREARDLLDNLQNNNLS